MSYSGLGQSASSVVSLPAGSALIVALQQALARGGVLTIRTADGRIGASSPTIAAIQAWATQNGLSATGVARTSGSGLAIPQGLLDAIIHAPAAAGGGTATPTTTGGGKGGGGGTTALPSAALPDVALTNGGMPTWAPWAIGATLVAILAGGAVVAMRR